MIRSMYTAATGMKAQQLFVDNISNNLANVNTMGFKKSKFWTTYFLETLRILRKMFYFFSTIYIKLMKRDKQKFCSEPANIGLQTLCYCRYTCDFRMCFNAHTNVWATRKLRARNLHRMKT